MMVTKAKMTLDPLEIDLETVRGKTADVLKLLETTVKNLRETPYPRMSMTVHIKAEA